MMHLKIHWSQAINALGSTLSTAVFQRSIVCFTGSNESCVADLSSWQAVLLMQHCLQVPEPELLDVPQLTTAVEVVPRVLATLPHLRAQQQRNTSSSCQLQNILSSQQLLLPATCSPWTAGRSQQHTCRQHWLQVTALDSQVAAELGSDGSNDPCISHPAWWFAQQLYHECDVVLITIPVCPRLWFKKEVTSHQLKHHARQGPHVSSRTILST